MLPPAISESCNTCRALLGRRVGRGNHLVGHGRGPDLAEFVERPQDGRRAVGQPKPFEQARQHHPVVDADGKLAESDRAEQIVNDQRRFDVGGDRAGADRVEIALHELAVAAALGVFAAPDRGDVIPLERHAQLVGVLGHKPGQRHRQVESQADPTPAVVLELVELFVGFVAALAGEDFQVFKGRRVDRAEAVGAIHPPRRVDQPLARNHRLRRIVAEAFERAGSDACRFGHGRRGVRDQGSGVRDWKLPPPLAASRFECFLLRAARARLRHIPRPAPGVSQ